MRHAELLVFARILAAGEPGFRPFTPLHYLTLLGCVALVGGSIFIGKKLQQQGKSGAEPRWRHTQGWMCLVIYVLYQIWMWLPQNFRWDESLPLEFCDVGMLVAAGAMLARARWLRGLLYFWLTVFTVQAFLTPVVQKGPARPEFWLFWLAHTSIANAAIYDLVVGKFRPDFQDAVRSYVISFFYAVALLIIDNLSGWNYGFVGPFKPATPTLIDALGDYPLRLVWMVLIAAVGFTIAWLPWAIVRRRR